MYVHPIPVKAISQERLERISSDFKQTSTWSQWQTELNGSRSKFRFSRQMPDDILFRFGFFCEHDISETPWQDFFKLAINIHLGFNLDELTGFGGSGVKGQAPYGQMGTHALDISLEPNMLRYLLRACADMHIWNNRTCAQDGSCSWSELVSQYNHIELWTESHNLTEQTHLSGRFRLWTRECEQKGNVTKSRLVRESAGWPVSRSCCLSTQMLSWMFLRSNALYTLSSHKRDTSIMCHVAIRRNISVSTNGNKCVLCMVSCGIILFRI